MPTPSNSSHAPAHPRDFRMAAAERHQAIANSEAGKAKSALKRASLWTRFGLRNAVDKTKRAIERVTTPMPKAKAAGDLLIVAHRGSPMKAVENTIPACEYAMEREGANALEIDLCMTQDGEVVLWHDWVPEGAVAYARQLGIEPGVKYSPTVPSLWSGYRRPIHELTFEQLKEHYGFASKFFFFFKRKAQLHIPTVEEFVTWARTRSDLRTVYFDIKMPADQVASAAEMAAKIKAALDNGENQFESIFMTPYEEVLRAMREATPDFEFCLDTEIPPGIVKDPSQYSAVRRAEECGNRIAAVGRPVLTMGGWRIYQEIIEGDLARIDEIAAAQDDPTKVPSLLSWTFDNRSEAKRLLRLGIPAILTNRPARILRVARKAGRKTR